MTRCIFITLCCLFLLRSAQCQVVAVGLDKMNILYVGKPNHITVASAKYPCSKLILSTNNGVVTKDSDGYYTVVPDHPQPNMTISIDVQTARGKEHEGSSLYRAKYQEIPEKSYLGGKSSGNIDCDVVQYANAPSYLINGYWGDTKYFINNFTVSITRGGKEIFKKTITNPVRAATFSQNAETAEAIKTLHVKDNLKITNITYKCYLGECSGSLPPLDFTITD